MVGLSWLVNEVSTRLKIKYRFEITKDLEKQKLKKKN